MIHNDGGSSALVFGKSRGSLNGNTIVQNGDVLGSTRDNFYGADGNNLNSDAAQIAVEVDGTPGATDMPGRILFKTTADGASSPTERMRIDSSGNVGIGTTSLFSAPGYGALTLSGSTGGALAKHLRLTTRRFEIYGDNTNGLRVYDRTNTTERLRIDNSGRLLVGTSSGNCRTNCRISLLDPMTLAIQA